MSHNNGSKGRSHDAQMREDIERIRSMANALGAGAADEFQRGTARAIAALVETNAHLLAENEHLKKAMDLMLEQIFRAQRGNS